MQIDDTLRMLFGETGTAIVIVFILCVTILLVMKIINKVKTKASTTKQLNELEELRKQPLTVEQKALAERFLQEVDEAKKEYFTYRKRVKLTNTYRPVYYFFNRDPYNKIAEENIFKFKEIYFDLEAKVKEWNEEYVKNELVHNKGLFDNIDGKSLDNQQRRAVVIDEDNNLVLAGAGSGKTLTISAKVKYLVDRKNVLPEEILLISYTRKAAEEMYRRISDKLHIEVESMTFHRLGLGIITNNRMGRPDIAEELDAVITKYFNEDILRNKLQLQLLVTFFGYYLNIPKDLKEFENLGESHDFYRNVDFETIRGKIENPKFVQDEINRLKVNKETLQGETVKSLEELMIANFLYLNGIDYVYEYKYPFEQDDKYRKQYRPDFYLPEYNIYIEHFGITQDYRVPWLTEIEAKKYLDGIKWKRETHQKNKTVMLETYSYYNKDGVLLKKLEESLKKKGVQFKQRDFKEIYEKIFANKQDKYFTEFKKLISSFINLFKSNGHTEESFEKLKIEVNKIENTFLKERSKIFLNLVKPIYVNYEKQLKDNNMIDFHDMINEATSIVKAGKHFFKYKYIIVDEYQDISMSRFNLIKEIKNKTNAKVMCVGDDWQSIYRFAGSDINLFTNFDKHLGYHELLKIENTYRNSQELINIAGKFIMKNQRQLRKDLKSSKHHSNPIRVLSYNTTIFTALKKALEEIVYQFGVEAEVTILGRNNFDIEFINAKEELGSDFKLVKTKDDVKVKWNKYPHLNINFLTAHRSKGLESDNVIVINLENKLVGFPNKISDDPILSLVLTGVDDFNFAEERRLFYVALTRTKNTTYLLTPESRPSSFCEELIKDFNIRKQNSDGSQPLQQSPNCPRCQKGHLVIRENAKDNSKFLGCSNYPFCDLAFKQLEILNNHVKCSACGGYMVKRSGRYGEFYGCTNYPYCNNALKINQI